MDRVLVMSIDVGGSGGEKSIDESKGGLCSDRDS